MFARGTTKPELIVTDWHLKLYLTIGDQGVLLNDGKWCGWRDSGDVKRSHWTYVSAYFSQLLQNKNKIFPICARFAIHPLEGAKDNLTLREIQ